MPPPPPGVPPARYAYLGPEGTFTEQALRLVPAAERADLQPCATVTLALDAVRNGEADGAVVPIENSVEGSVPVTLDELATGEPLMITREITVPIAFSLVARPGTVREDIRRIGTHPHAAAQTRSWVARHLPGATVVHATSTAAAAAALATDEAPWDAAISAPVAADHYRLAVLADGSAPYDAALSAPMAAAHYPVEVLADGVADNAGAVTRFVLVARPAPPPLPTGGDKTSLVAFIADDHPGALLEILTEFSVRGVNLTRIESRPTGAGMGRYYFSIDAEGHVDDARVGEALTGLRRICADVRFLGSYPRCDGAAPMVRRGTSDAEFRDAQAWLARVREGRAI